MFPKKQPSKHNLPFGVDILKNYFEYYEEAPSGYLGRKKFKRGRCWRGYVPVRMDAGYHNREGRDVLWSCGYLHCSCYGKFKWIAWVYLILPWSKTGNVKHFNHIPSHIKRRSKPRIYKINSGRLQYNIQKLFE